MVEFLFQAFCSAEEGVKRGRPTSFGSDLLSVTRRMRDPKVGSVMIDPAGPIANGSSGYGSTLRSVRAQYAGGPHLLSCAGPIVAGLCAAHAASTVNHPRKTFTARFIAARFSTGY